MRGVHHGVVGAHALRGDRDAECAAGRWPGRSSRSRSASSSTGRASTPPVRCRRGAGCSCGRRSTSTGSGAGSPRSRTSTAPCASRSIRSTGARCCSATSSSAMTSPFRGRSRTSPVGWWTARVPLRQPIHGLPAVARAPGPEGGGVQLRGVVRGRVLPVHGAPLRRVPGPIERESEEDLLRRPRPGEVGSGVLVNAGHLLENPCSWRCAGSPRTSPTTGARTGARSTSRSGAGRPARPRPGLRVAGGPRDAEAGGAGARRRDGGNGPARRCHRDAGRGGDGARRRRRDRGRAGLAAPA